VPKPGVQRRRDHEHVGVPHLRRNYVEGDDENIHLAISAVMADGLLSCAAFMPPPPFCVVDISSPKDTVEAAPIPERCVMNAIDLASQAKRARRPWSASATSRARRDRPLRE
jgi:hypothetical protein